MKLKNAPNDLQSMAQDGDAILRSLQNKSLPIVDLMVRESLQNSLDATLPESSETIVDFTLGKFNSYQFATNLEGVEDNLNSKYNEYENFIAIRDKNTSGLTGNYSSTDPEELNKSNFYKLVFGIGKNQEAEGAGGSWGLGKTSYFRIGAGIVIYYTRVKIDNGFEERLIASLIESPKQKEKLLPNNVRGIAWWGEYKDETDERIFPLTDSEKIKAFLEIFGLSQYTNEETGTTIIIPYLKDFNLNEDEEKLYPWEEDKELALKYAIQRWYNPRLNNEEYRKLVNNSKLIARVNEEPLLDNYNIEPFFELMKDLYTNALKGESEDKTIVTQPIYLKKNGMDKPSKTPVGHIAFKKVSKEELKMTPPDNRYSPLELIGLKNEKKVLENTSKIIAYCRKPGMIVEYSIDGEWAPKASLFNENDLLIGFFVPNSEGPLAIKFQKEGYDKLEQYLRATENADHANWIDEDGFGIINRMKITTSKIISDFYQGNDSEKQSSATSGISRKFGKLFLPPKNYGRTSTSKRQNNTNSRISSDKNRLADINILSSEPIDRNTVKVEFEASIKNTDTSVVYLEVLSQEKKMTKKDWIKTMGEEIQFPFEISDIKINKINEQILNKNIEQFNDEQISIYQESNNLDEFIIKNMSNDKVIVSGEMVIKTNTLDFIPNVSIASDKYKEKGDD